MGACGAVAVFGSCQGRLMHIRAACAGLLMTGTLTLGACGMGGDGSSVAGAAMGAVAPGSSPPNSTVPAPTYDAASYSYGFFMTLNTVRHALGLGVLAQDTSLDTSAQKHADYLAQNFDPDTMAGVDPSTGILYAHSEDSGVPGFYGAIPQSRAMQAGYAYAVGEVAGTTVQATADNGAEAVRSLLNTVYHRADILSDAPRNIGIGANAAGNAYEKAGWGVADLGLVSGAQTLARGTTFVYPAEGATAAPPYFSNGSEIPEPLPELGSSAKLGGPVSLQVPAGDTLTVNSFTLTDASGNDVPVMLLDSATDTSGYLPANSAFIVPAAPLTPGMRYTASFNGADGPAAVVKTWPFTAAGTITVNTAGPYVVHTGGSLTISTVVPSGILSIRYTSSLSPGQVSAAFVSNESIALTVAAGAVSAATPLQLTLSDPNLSAVPPVTLAVTVEP